MSDPQSWQSQGRAVRGAAKIFFKYNIKYYKTQIFMLIKGIFMQMNVNIKQL